MLRVQVLGTGCSRASSSVRRPLRAVTRMPDRARERADGCPQTPFDDACQARKGIRHAKDDSKRGRTPETLAIATTCTRTRFITNPIEPTGSALRSILFACTHFARYYAKLRQTKAQNQTNNKPKGELAWDTLLVLLSIHSVPSHNAECSTQPHTTANPRRNGSEPSPISVCVRVCVCVHTYTRGTGTPKKRSAHPPPKRASHVCQRRQPNQTQGADTHTHRAPPSRTYAPFPAARPVPRACGARCGGGRACAACCACTGSAFGVDRA